MDLKERLDTYLGKTPEIDETAYVSKHAVLIGDVKIGKNASVWPGCVLRADINSIELGENSNIQDGTMVHLADDAGVKIGKNTTIGLILMALLLLGYGWYVKPSEEQIAMQRFGKLPVAAEMFQVEIVAGREVVGAQKKESEPQNSRHQRQRRNRSCGSAFCRPLLLHG